MGYLEWDFVLILLVEVNCGPLQPFGNVGVGLPNLKNIGKIGSNESVHLYIDLSSKIGES